MPAYHSKFTLTGRMGQIVFSVDLPAIKAVNAISAAKKARKYVETHAKEIFQSLIDVGGVEVTGEVNTIEKYLGNNKTERQERKREHSKNA